MGGNCGDTIGCIGLIEQKIRTTRVEVSSTVPSRRGVGRQSILSSISTMILGGGGEYVLVFVPHGHLLDVDVELGLVEKNVFELPPIRQCAISFTIKANHS